jgi:uncharacterized delta-60 repeat protein
MKSVYLLLFCASTALGQQGSVDPTFAAELGSPSGRPISVRAVALQGDGRILIGGAFESVSGAPMFRIARLNRDGSRDENFPFVDPNDEVVAVAVQTDGRIIFVGSFTSVGGKPRTYIARLTPDGALDEGFAPVFSGPPGSIAVAETAFWIGGGFSTVDGVSRSGLAKFHVNGSLDLLFRWNYSYGSHANAIIPDGAGAIVVGVLKTNGVNASIARLEPDGGDALDFVRNVPGFNATTVALGLDQKIYVSGNGETVRLNPDGTQDPEFIDRTHGPFAASHVKAFALLPDGKLLLADTVLGQSLPPTNRLVRLMSDGTVDPTFVAVVDTNVNAIVVQPDGRILIGGNFTTVNGISRPYVARLLNRPVIALRKSLQFSWPSVYTNYTLEWSATAPSTEWTPVSPAPVSSAGIWSVTNDISAPARFYRLRQE